MSVSAYRADIAARVLAATVKGLFMNLVHVLLVTF
jgi:hypothetical protein